jgi:hypothetical protein
MIVEAPKSYADGDRLMVLEKQIVAPLPVLVVHVRKIH